MNNIIIKEKFMKLAIQKAKEGIKKKENPFGACIVRNNKIVSCTHNKVFENIDVSSHAELIVIKEACRKLNTIDLSQCILYSTCEPCPMCFSAIHFAKISMIVFGISIEDGKKLGYLKISRSCKKTKILLNSSVKIIGGFLKDENLKLIKLWEKENNIR